ARKVVAHGQGASGVAHAYCLRRPRRNGGVVACAAGVSSGLMGLEQLPLAELRTPTSWHWSNAVQTTGLPTQAPAWHGSGAGVAVITDGAIGEWHAHAAVTGLAGRAAGRRRTGCGQAGSAISEAGTPCRGDRLRA